MNKTISILVEEYKNDIIKVTNESGLPASILKEILGNLYNEISKLADTELKRDRQAISNENTANNEEV